MRRKIKEYLKTWKTKGYRGGIPDEVPARLEQLNKAPSYKAIVKAILKNDIALTSLGYSKPFSQIYSNIKKEEIENRKTKSNECI